MNNIIKRRALHYPQCVAYKEPVSIPFELEAMENASLLDVIYAQDPVTKLPKGDIALFMSDSTSPEVRQFISQNLHGLIDAESPQIPADFEGDLSDLLRAKGETRDEYISRVSDLMRDEVFNENLRIQKEKELKDLEDE